MCTKPKQRVVRKGANKSKWYLSRKDWLSNPLVCEIIRELEAQEIYTCTQRRLDLCHGKHCKRFRSNKDWRVEESFLGCSQESQLGANFSSIEDSAEETRKKYSTKLGLNEFGYGLKSISGQRHHVHAKCAFSHRTQDPKWIEILPPFERSCCFIDLQTWLDTVSCPTGKYSGRSSSIRI